MTDSSFFSRRELAFYTLVLWGMTYGIIAGWGALWFLLPGLWPLVFWPFVAGVLGQLITSAPSLVTGSGAGTTT